jgi:hypothetical protein
MAIHARFYKKKVLLLLFWFNKRHSFGKWQPESTWTGWEREREREKSGNIHIKCNKLLLLRASRHVLTQPFQWFRGGGGGSSTHTQKVGERENAGLLSKPTKKRTIHPRKIHFFFFSLSRVRWCPVCNAKNRPPPLTKGAWKLARSLMIV